MSEKIKEFNQQSLKKNLPDLRVGDIVKVHQKVPASTKGKKGAKDKKDRIQIFEGVVLAIKHGKGVSATFTVRKIISGIGVEKIYPLHSPNIAKIEIVSRSKVRRSKLYYLRERSGKKAKLKRKQYVPGEETLGESAEAETEPETKEEPQTETESESVEPEPKTKDEN